MKREYCEIAADIARELTEHPERWCQGLPARDAAGQHIAVEDPAAASWCLWGHVMRRAAPDDYPMALFGKLSELRPEIMHGLGTWNDQPKRTVQDIVELCEAAARCKDS